MRFNFFEAPISKEFDPKEKLPGFETFESAKADRTKLIDLLVEFGGPKAIKLAERLGRCHSKRSRCRSACCPVCARRFRRWWTSTASELMDASGEDWFVISLVPTDEKYGVGKLHKFKPQRSKDRLRRQLDRSGIGDIVVIGGIDFALQFLEGGKPVWRPHYYLLASGHSKKRIRRKLKHLYSADDHTRKPLVVKAVGKKRSDLLKVTSYTFKMTFEQKAPGFDWSGEMRTIGTPLEDIYYPELARCLHRWGFGQRIVRRNFRDNEARMRVR